MNTEIEKNKENQADSCCSNASCCPPATPYVRETPKLGRNEPCFCGSEKKFKKCCGRMG